MTKNLVCDVAIIGAGTAGLAAERAARKGGASTLLIDPDFNGTTCATVGCMPSKLLIAAARRAREVRQSGRFGITVDAMRIEGPAVMRRLRAERDRFAAATRQSIEDLPAGVALRGRARFDGPTRLCLNNGRLIDAGAIVIATGSVPVVPPSFAALGELALTSNTVFQLSDLPKRLAVVGSGAIGLELAQAFARLGVEVELFDAAERLAKVRCPKVHAVLRDIIGADLQLQLGVDVAPRPGSGGVELCWTGNSEGTSEFDRVLVAVGRRPCLDGLELDRAGLLCDEDGVPVHDRATMRCGDSAVFLAGDVSADLPLLHEASHEGAIAGRNAAALPAPMPSARNTAFSITFTDPAFATIGNAEADGAVTGTSDFSDQGRARVEACARGMLTLYAAAPDGRLIGADLVAPAGEHLAHLLAWAIQAEATASQLLEMPFDHPTMEEGLKDALRMICRATPLPLPVGQDSGSPAGA